MIYVAWSAASVEAGVTGYDERIDRVVKAIHELGTQTSSEAQTRLTMRDLPERVLQPLAKRTNRLPRSR